MILQYFEEKRLSYSTFWHIKATPHKDRLKALRRKYNEKISVLILSALLILSSAGCSDSGNHGNASDYSQQSQSSDALQSETVSSEASWQGEVITEGLVFHSNDEETCRVSGYTGSSA